MILGKLCMETIQLESLTRIIQPLTVRGPLNVDIEGIAYDSRQVRDRYLFVALRGQRQNGTKFIEEAIRRGAVAIVSEEDQWTRRDIAHIRVADARLALAEISCAFYDRPSERIEVIGITGTNGKTTTSYMARDILWAAGRPTGLIGTVRYEIGKRIIPATRTTPEAPDVQFMLDQMVRAGCRSAVMEVSSHALDQKRVWGIDYDVGVFTNLTRDHLDYHQSMQRYFDAKSQLFRGLGQLEKRAAAVINIDDQWGMQLANTPGLTAGLVTYGLHGAAMVRAEDLDLSPQSSSFTFVSPWGNARVTLRLLGRYNVFNALAAMSACGAMGVEPGLMAETLGKMTAVPGRLEQVPSRRGFSVFVDYAHTDDALANVLTTLRELRPKRLLAVYGCGGDRDKTKRPLMGAVGVRLAHHVILTSDNPRKEDPDAIIRDIEAGLEGSTNYDVVVDREQAIARAIGMAQPGDIVLIAGKGHENYQEFASTIVPFDDREVARRYLG
ncbi:MAG TPA: UDP-N-acetylmuramoyl-L-alanyl-D-glutamate--2,6-diaminopimelate ligase [Kiritimatiellia bacterium]|jgi:UDP-N-acetylmuramoyl-L-alanyl-D-glutamate--2,6-diaminopimelate ligase